ncbi:SDR family NAD(P)-dependent oxidoreductase [Blastococcus sp. SYSU D00820]
MHRMTATDLAGGTAVVTGAAAGIGAAIARAAAARGMSVVLADADADGAERVAGELTDAGAAALAVRCDVSDAAAVDALARVTAERFGDVRLLVNNAGIEATGRLWELDAARFARLVGVNVTGVFHGIRSFLPRMVEAGTPAWVVTTASIGAVTTLPAQAPYCASKHAALALTECLAIELADSGVPIGVSCLMPGPVDTGIYASAPASGDGGAVARERMAELLRTRGISPAEVAGILFAGIGRGDFWITTDDERADLLLRRRADRLTGRLRPA